MQKYKGYRKLQRNGSERKALLIDLTTDVIMHERIKTTEAKAKEAQISVEKLITLAKVDNFNTRRKAATKLRAEVIEGEEKDVKIMDKLFNDVAKRFENRPGGYTRIIKLDNRRGDDAPIVILELVD